MEYGILSVKLCEMDEKIRTMHRRIQISESEQHNKIRNEMEVLQKEFLEEEKMLRKKLEQSHAGFVSSLSDAYMKIEDIIDNVKMEISEHIQNSSDTICSAEEKILLAEYVLDFAIQATNSALLISMEAIDAQITQQEREGSCL